MILYAAWRKAEIPESLSIDCYDGHDYILYKGWMTWDEAQAFCESNGGHLATVTSEGEREFLNALIDEQLNYVWLGATDEAEEGNWQWVTGEEFSYSDWYFNDIKEQPDNARGLEHYLGTTTDNKWNDFEYKSWQIQGFVYEKDDHTWGDWTEIKAPTCTANGINERTCSRCGASETADIPVLGHTPGEAIITVATTCISEGIKTTYCDLCGDKLSEETIPAIGHNWSEWQVQNESTITDIGTLIRYCENCESNEIKENIVAEGVCGENITWVINDIGALILMGYGETYSYSSDDSPWGEYQDEIKYATVGEGISELGSFLFFGCNNLERAYLPNSVESFGTYTFGNCDNLTIYCSFTSKALSFAMLKSINYVLTDTIIDLQIIRAPFKTVYPVGATLLTYGLKLKVINDLGDEAEFTTGYSIEEYDFSTAGEKNITIIFNGISKNFTVTVDDSLEPETYIASGTYSSDVYWVLGDDGTLEICGEGEIPPLTKPWSSYNDSIRNIIISQGVTGIGVQAFDSVPYLESVVISDTVMYIYGTAFSNNLNLKTVFMPNSIVRIDPNVFNGSTGVTIQCYENSLAHSYAIENSINYELISGIPEISVDNYTVTITLADNITAMRYASGEHTTASSIKNASDRVDLSASVIAKNTVDGNFVYTMPNGGYYTFWMRMSDGTEYLLVADMTEFIPTVDTYGVKLTVNNLYDAKDFFIAKGEFNSYNEIKDNGYIVRVTDTKIGTKKNYTYTVSEPGMHTVLVRYNDGREFFFHEELVVDEPVFTTNGLQVTISNIPDVKVIRTAYGEYTTPGDTKRAEGARNYSNKAVIKDADEYTLQYREEGRVTIVVEYNNGYVKVFHYDVTKKTPTMEQTGNTVTFGDLDGLVMVRYAMGEYATSSEIKRAEGSKVIKPDSIIDGKITVADLATGTYTFCVQYDDESYNYYTVTVD